jgi:putative beta-1,4-xylosyltransferase IRX9
MQVSTLIEQIVEDESEMEGLMNDCSRVMVWNIDLESSYSFYPKKWITENNLDIIWNLPLV